MRRGLASVLAVMAAAAITATARAEVRRRQPGGVLARPGPGHASSSAAPTATLLTSELSRRRVHALALARRLPGLRARARPAATPTTTDVFVRGGDSALYHQYFTTAGGWSGYGAARPLDALRPGASRVRRGSGNIDIFWRGADNGIEAKSWVAGSGLDRRRTTPRSTRADAVGARRSSRATTDLRRRDRARDQRPRVPQRLERLGAGAAGRRSPAA